MSRKPRNDKQPRNDDDLSTVPKPGLNSSVSHIALLFPKQPELAEELTRRLMPHLARRLGVRRRTGRLTRG